MRKEHYERVVRWDRRRRFPERKHGEERPEVKKVTRMWGRKGQGYKVGRVTAACSGRRRRTGRRPERVYTKKSVAERRLEKGDPIGCMVKVSGKEAYVRREKRRVRERGEMRRQGMEGKLGVDKEGNITRDVGNPGGLLGRKRYREERGGLMEVGGKYGRYRSREMGGVKSGKKTREVGKARREGRRVPV
jgi:ribosomal protein L5